MAFSGNLLWEMEKFMKKIRNIFKKKW
jgi:hypothetical protein